MTPMQTARQLGQQAVFCCWGLVRYSHAQTNEGFLVLENAPDLWAAINSWALVLALTVQSCVTELIVSMGHKGRVPLSYQGWQTTVRMALSEWQHVASMFLCLISSHPFPLKYITYFLAGIKSNNVKKYVQ